MEVRFKYNVDETKRIAHQDEAQKRYYQREIEEYVNHVMNEMVKFDSKRTQDNQEHFDLLDHFKTENTAIKKQMKQQEILMQNMQRCFMEY